MKIKRIIHCKKCGKECGPQKHIKDYCRNCYNMLPKRVARRAELMHKRWLKVKADPVLHKEWLERCRKHFKTYFKKHPNYYKEYYAKLKADPIRWAKQLAYYRKKYRDKKRNKECAIKLLDILNWA